MNRLETVSRLWSLGVCSSRCDDTEPRNISVSEGVLTIRRKNNLWIVMYGRRPEGMWIRAAFNEENAEVAGRPQTTLLTSSGSLLEGLERKGWKELVGPELVGTIAFIDTILAQALVHNTNRLVRA